MQDAAYILSGYQHANIELSAALRTARMNIPVVMLNRNKNHNKLAYYMSVGRQITDHVLFNYLQIVEQTIGSSQLIWRTQQLKDNRLPAKSNVLFAARCTIAAAVLHNRFTNFL